MKRIIATIGLGLVLPGAVHGQVMSNGASTSMPAVPANLPRAIADLMAPRDLVLAKTEQGFDQQFDAQMAASPSSAVMEKTYPGISAVIRDETRRQVLKAMGDELPKLCDRIATVFAGDFDLVEQRQVYDFLSTPAGRRLVALGDKIYNQDKLRKQADLAQAGKKGVLTGSDLAAAVDPSGMDALPAVDRAALEAFATTPGGIKFATATPKLQQTMAEWMNGLAAAHQAEIQAAVTAKVTAFIAQSAKKP